MSDPADAVEDIQADAEEALAQDGEVVAGIIEAGTLQQFVDTVGSLVSEARVHFNRDGLSVTCVDPANVAMYGPVELAARAFEHYEAPGQAVLGVNFDTLDERLGPANSGDLVEFVLDMETRTLRLEYRNITQRVALINPDTVRQEPDSPDLDLPNSVTITGQQFDEAVSVAEMYAGSNRDGHLDIVAEPDEREVRFTVEGDTDDATITVSDDEAIAADVSEQTVSMFGVPYLDDFASPMPSEVEVTLTFGEEFPLTVEYEACEGALSVFASLAPRIKTQ